MFAIASRRFRPRKNPILCKAQAGFSAAQAACERSCKVSRRAHLDALKSQPAAHQAQFGGERFHVAQAVYTWLTVGALDPQNRLGAVGLEVEARHDAVFEQER